MATILLVGDGATASREVTGLLEAAGHRVETQADPAAVVAAVNRLL